MQNEQTKRDRKISNILLFAGSLLPVMLLVFVLFNRTRLPFALEWGEGAGVNQIQQILSGSPLYSAPDSQFAALVYTPLYYYISAGIARITGNALLAARFLSAISAFGTSFLIGFLVWQKTKNDLASWLSGALYLACFTLSDGFYDLVRVDSFYVFWAVIVYFAALKANKPVSYLLIGVLVAVGFFIKQSFLVLFAPYLAGLLIFEKRSFWPAFLGALTGIVIPLALIHAATDGWFFYYVFQLPREHGISIISAVNFWIGDTASPLAVAIIFTLVYFSFKLKQFLDAKNNSQNLKPVLWVELTLGAGFLLGSWITRSTAGGGPNNVMPFYAFLAISFGLGVDLILKKVNDDQGFYYGAAVFALLIQFVGLIFNPFNYIPTRDEIDLNRQIISLANNHDQKLFVPYRSQLVRENDHPDQIHIVNLFELTGYFGGEIRPEGIRIVNAIREEICNQEFHLIILDQPIPWFEDQLAAAYQPAVSKGGAELQHSKQLDWQLGEENTYIPHEGADQSRCLETIKP